MSHIPTSQAFDTQEYKPQGGYSAVGPYGEAVGGGDYGNNSTLTREISTLSELPATGRR